MKKILGLMVMIGIFGLHAQATDNLSDNLTIPHTFNSGETISSSKVNENFQALSGRINDLIQTGDGWVIIGNYQIVNSTSSNTDTITFKYAFKEDTNASVSCKTGGSSGGGTTSVGAGQISFTHYEICDNLTLSAEGFIER